MVDWFLIVTIVVAVIVFILINVKMLFYYESEDDRSIGKSILTKGMIVVSLLLAWMLIILLPLDVYNSRPSPGGLDMHTCWIVFYLTILVFLLGPIPFCSFYYEADSDSRVTTRKPWIQALIYSIATLVIVGLIIGISYPFLSEAAVPVARYACTEILDGLATAMPNGPCNESQSAFFVIPVSFEIYITALLCFVGWWLFIVFGGIGLTALPIDLVIAFIDRPKPSDIATYQDRKKELSDKTMLLKRLGEDLRQKEKKVQCETGLSGMKKKRDLKREFNRFRSSVFLLEQETAWVKIVKDKSTNPLICTVKLIGGLLCGAVSLLWILHILLYILIRLDGITPVAGFFNTFLRMMDKTGFPLFSIISFAFLLLYLLACVIKGCFKFGMRFFILPIHPMRPGDTTLNSFLFNITMILLSSSALVQFSLDAFEEYSRLTAAEIIFSAQIKYMNFFSAFFATKLFIYMFLVWSFLTAIYLCCKPRDRMAFQLSNSGMNKAANTDKVKMAKIMGRSGQDKV
eukprot:GHVL01011824.1.p1 GENE.GHVL01011824.1~~GHVL01011824.1.p1  ORF type:complete len:516 (-),score=48.93 GHVL01011824.1:435-1982(-)